MPLGAVWLLRLRGEITQFCQKLGLKVSLWAEQWMGTWMSGVSVALVVLQDKPPQCICALSSLGPLHMQELGWWLDHIKI